MTIALPLDAEWLENDEAWVDAAGYGAQPPIVALTNGTYTHEPLWYRMPGDRAYRPRYEGGVRDRDAAYHQGTVWPWLIGPFVDAWLEVNGDDPPHTPRGCPFQAWSTGELIRALARTERP